MPLTLFVCLYVYIIIGAFVYLLFLSTLNRLKEYENIYKKLQRDHTWEPAIYIIFWPIVFLVILGIVVCKFSLTK